MLIRHDPHLSRGRILMPVPRCEWMPPSRAQQKTVFGDEDRTRFRVRARAHDGHVAWTGWFEDRDDADAFLFALVSGSIRYERELWRLPTPEWHPGLTDLVYDFLTQTILTTTGSNQTYTSPSDWNNSDNTIECLGAGASGGRAGGSTGHATGGGGGAFSLISNFSFASPGTTTATYRVGAGATSTAGGGLLAGTAGGPSWFNDTVDPGNGSTNAKCSAAGGAAGAAGSGSRNGGAGGATTAGWGTTKYAGGRGGNLTGASGYGGSGGGGAAGPAGAGGDGTDSTSTSTGIQTAGGSANNGTTAGGAANIIGNNGTEFSGSYGCGSGGGGSGGGGIGQGRAGGNYGAGGGGGGFGSTATGGAGIQGLVIVEYTPAAGSLIFNPLPFQHILVR